MGWISAERGGRCSWRGDSKKTGSMYLRRRWSLWTFIVMLLAWYSICHTARPVLFRATNANPEPAFFQSHQHLDECNIPSVRWKSCAFYKVVRWHFSGVVSKGVTVCFLLRYVNNLKYTVCNIILLKNGFFGFPKVKWLQYTGEVGKSTSCWCQIFAGFNTPEIIKIG